MTLTTGILCKSLGFEVFAKIFSKNIMIPSREIPFFGKAPQRFWAITTKFSFFGFLWMTRITKFVYSGHPNNQIFGSSGHPNNRITKYLVLWVTQITEFGDSVFFGFIRILHGSSGKFTKEEPACDCLPFNDQSFTMMHTTAAVATLLSVPTPMVLLYIASVMITYMKELHYGVFNNQSCAKSDFSLSINTAQMKIVPIPFMAHKYFLSAYFLVLIISHINMMLIVMFERPRRLHNGGH
jgi:hypothetical protein